jgi:hypothetical protein
MDPKFFRNYLDIISEAPVQPVQGAQPIKPAQPTPPTQQPTPTQQTTQPAPSKDDADYNRWATADQSRRMWQYGHSQAQSYNDPTGKDYMAVGGKEGDDLVNRFATKASAAAGSPEREAQFKQRYQQDTNPDNITLKPDDSYAYSLKEEGDEELDKIKKLIKK